ncbi:TetR/AcrR family transcriptional regulator [Stappia sp.]|uniref:TetR/AcrR family transcriptional regulator n=1 Tax=Stappia sp. TaxID=1870903 RepID=UPI003A99D338
MSETIEKTVHPVETPMTHEMDPRDGGSRDGSTSSAAIEMRRRIVEKASELFHIYGFQKTTVADIARELGMSPANVYRFFSSKAALTKAVAGLVTWQVRQQMQKGMEMPAQTCAEQLRIMVKSHFHYMRDRYTDFRKIHDLLEAAMEEAWDVVQVHKEEERRSFAAVIREGIARGEFPEQDADSAAMLFQHSLLLFFHPALVAETCRCLPEGHQDLLFDPLVDFSIAALRDGRYREVPEEVKRIFTDPSISSAN